MMRKQEMKIGTEVMDTEWSDSWGHGKIVKLEPRVHVKFYRRMNKVIYSPAEYRFLKKVKETTWRREK